MWMFVVALHTVSQEPGVFHMDSLLPPGDLRALSLPARSWGKSTQDVTWVVFMGQTWKLYLSLSSMFPWLELSHGHT